MTMPWWNLRRLRFGWLDKLPSLLIILTTPFYVARYYIRRFVRVWGSFTFMTRVNFLLSFVALMWTAGVLVMARAQPMSERVAVQAHGISELDRRVTALEGMKIGEELAAIKTTLSDNRYYQETSRNLTYGLYVPVCLLALGKVLDFLDKKRR